MDRAAIVYGREGATVMPAWCGHFHSLGLSIGGPDTAMGTWAGEDLDPGGEGTSDGGAVVHGLSWTKIPSVSVPATGVRTSGAALAVPATVDE